MDYPRWLAYQVLEVVRTNRFWMGWNLFLAFIPAVLAVVLFLPAHRRRAWWWMGVGVFVLFLPNAPYVITDLVHLRGDIVRAPTDGVVLLGVLPLYATFIALGFGSYLICLALIEREVHDVRPAWPGWSIEVVVHAVCSVGIVLGRIARLNSWDTASNPVGTLELTFNTLTWSGAPFAIVAVFLAVVATTTVLRALVSMVGRWIRPLLVVPLAA